MQKTRFNIESENFDLYFASLLPMISPQAKEGLPKDVLYRLFRRGGEVNGNGVYKLGFISKLFILWKCFRKRIFIVVEDEERGLSVEDFVELRTAIKLRDYGTPRAEGLVADGTFITANKELCDSFAYLNTLSNSGAYTYLKRAKNPIPNKTADFVAQMKYIARVFSHYEGNKKKWVAAYGISIPEFLVLLYTYSGKDVLGSVMYRDIYKQAYQSSPTRVKQAFGTLQSKGYLKKTGSGSGAKMSITPLGTDITTTILTKYAINI